MAEISATVILFLHPARCSDKFPYPRESSFNKKWMAGQDLPARQDAHKLGGDCDPALLQILEGRMGIQENKCCALAYFLGLSGSFGLTST